MQGLVCVACWAGPAARAQELARDAWRVDSGCAPSGCVLGSYAREGAPWALERRSAMDAWPREPQWTPSTAIVPKGPGAYRPWMAGLAAAVGGYQTYGATRERRGGLARALGFASDRLELLPGRMGQDSGAKGIVGVSLFSCQGSCLGSAAVRKMNVSLVVNPKGDGGQRQLVLGATMLFH